MLLGIDMGTSSMKMGIFDSQGTQHYIARAEYCPEYPADGLAEINPLCWLNALTQLLQACPSSLRTMVKAMSFSGQMHGVVATAEDATPLYPAILWLDRRSGAFLSRFPDTLFDSHGNEPYPGAMGATLLWLRQSKPEIFQKTYRFLSPKDWLRAYLTGTFYSEPSDSCGTLLTDFYGHWDQTLMATLGLNIRQFPKIIGSTQITGTLRPECVKLLGLPVETLVIAGGGDTACAALGAGLLPHDHSVMLTTGTGAQLIKTSKTLPKPQAGLNLFLLPQLQMPAWYQMAAMLNCGSVLEWTRRQFNLEWNELYREAFNDDILSNAVEIIALPWLNGERTPWMDETLSAGWKNIKGHHKRSDLVYAMFRAVALSIKTGFDTFEDQCSMTQIIFAGGGSVHSAWRTLIANALNRPLLCLEEVDLSVRGAAMLAGLGSTRITLEALVKFVPAVTTRILPDPILARQLDRHQQILLKERL